MGCLLSKTKQKGGVSSNPASTQCIHYTTGLTSYVAACQVDKDLQSFDSTLHARTNQAISSIAAGVEVRAFSFDSLKEVTGCLLEMNQEVVKVILECKQDIWKNQELFELVEEYFDNSLQTLDFCSSLDACLKRARDTQLVILVALQQFEEDVHEADDKYARTLKELQGFKTMGDPFTDEFFQILNKVHIQQRMMLEKLQHKKKKIDKKLKYIHAFRKVSAIIFAATFAAVLICSVISAAIAAPPIAAAMAAASAIPIGSMGKWIDSLWQNYENVLRGQKELVNAMHVGAYVAIKDLENIRVLVDRLEMEIRALMRKSDFAVDEAALKVSVEEIRRKLKVFMVNVEELGSQADTCSRDIMKARTVVLQRIIKNPNSK